MRLLRISAAEVAAYRRDVRRGDRRRMPGAVRASAGINITENDVARLLKAVARIAEGAPPPVAYVQDATTGDFSPDPDIAHWQAGLRVHGSTCSTG
jgi:hypothetical protein